MGVEIREGSVVVVRPDFGRGQPLKVRVLYVDPFGKNNRTVIGYLDSEGQERWAYLGQIDRVILY